MAQEESERRKENLELIALAADLEGLASAAIRLAQRAAEGRRAEVGLADFMRTDFWPYRWRVYELWLLTRVLRLLQAQGGRITLLGIEHGVWMLNYSRSDAPVAICDIGGQRLNVFYQLYRKAQAATAHAQTADMPDIAVQRHGGDFLLVLDPKHGRSYSRRNVADVLDRYYRRLGADVTAIVNYMAMSAYRFEVTVKRGRIALLASDVAPQGHGIAPLEALIAKSLRAAGFTPPQSQEVIPMGFDRKPAQAARLLYWAGKAREVDEPAGLWMVEEDGGPVPLHGPNGDPAGVEVEAMFASADGGSCAIATNSSLVLASQALKTPLRLPKPDFFSRNGLWSPDGKSFALRLADRVLVLGENGSEIGRFLVKDLRSLCWLDDDRLVALVFKHGTVGGAVRITLPDRCGTMAEWEKGPGIGSELIALGPGQEILTFERDGLRFRLGTDGVLSELPWGSALAKIVSVSPSGRYRLADGPRSLRMGVELITVEDTGDPPEAFPLVRFVARRFNDIAWSPDETRVAFFAQGEDGSLRLMSFRLGDRYAGSASLPGQQPRRFVWLKPSLVRKLQTQWAEVAGAAPAS